MILCGLHTVLTKAALRLNHPGPNWPEIGNAPAPLPSTAHAHGRVRGLLVIMNAKLIGQSPAM